MGLYSRSAQLHVVPVGLQQSSADCPREHRSTRIRWSLRLSPPLPGEPWQYAGGGSTARGSVVPPPRCTAADRQTARLTLPGEGREEGRERIVASKHVLEGQLSLSVAFESSPTVPFPHMVESTPSSILIHCSTYIPH